MEIQLDHSELILATQRTIAAQLARDGRLIPGAELGLTFYAPSPDNVQVLVSLRKSGVILLQLRGDRRQLAAIATQLALDKLGPGAGKRYLPAAEVRWRIVAFTGTDTIIDRFVVDVTFQERRVG